MFERASPLFIARSRAAPDLPISGQFHRGAPDMAWPWSLDFHRNTDLGRMDGILLDVDLRREFWDLVGLALNSKLKCAEKTADSGDNDKLSMGTTIRANSKVGWKGSCTACLRVRSG